QCRAGPRGGPDAAERAPLTSRPRADGVDEFDIIRRFFLRKETHGGVIVGVGDDGAVVEPEPGHHLVVVVDTIIAGVHYPVDLAAADVGYRSLAVNLSDVAAMGGRPRWMTLALTLVEADESWLANFAKGLFEAADEHAVALIGGDKIGRASC